MISRQEAIQILDNERPHCGSKVTYSEGERCEAYDMAIEALSAERPKGRWIGEVIYTEIGEEHAMQECSHCGKVRIIDNFCPNCGSDNRGEEE